MSNTPEANNKQKKVTFSFLPTKSLHSLTTRSGNEYPQPLTPPSTQSPAKLLKNIEKTDEEILKVCEEIVKKSTGRTISKKLKVVTNDFKKDLYKFKIGGTSEIEMGGPSNETQGNSSFQTDTVATIIGNITKIIPVFSGENCGTVETDLHLFLNIAQAYYKTLDSQDQQIFLSFLPKLRLRGIPYEICKNRSFTDLDELQRALTSYYFPTRDLAGLTHSMQSCRQLNGETVRQFAQRVKLKLDECELYLNNLCKNGTNPVLAEYQGMAAQVFRRGLVSLSLKQYACMVQEKDFTGLVEKICQMEELENQSYGINSLRAYGQNGAIQPPYVEPPIFCNVRGVCDVRIKIIVKILIS